MLMSQLQFIMSKRIKYSGEKLSFKTSLKACIFLTFKENSLFSFSEESLSSVKVLLLPFIQIFPLLFTIL